MVTLHESSTIVTNGEIVPIMISHLLKTKIQTKHFAVDDHVRCYISRYSGGRFAVWDASWAHHNRYQVFDSEQILHDTFDEMPAPQ